MEWSGGIGGWCGRGSRARALEFSTDFATGINRARLQAGLKARLDTAEAAGSEAPEERPLAPFPPRPESDRGQRRNGGRGCGGRGRGDGVRAQ